MRTNALVALLLLAASGCSTRSRSRADAGTVERRGRAAPVEVQLPPSDDGWRCVATLTPGDDPTVGVVLVHQLGSTRREWAPLVERLQRGRAVTTLAVDLRGHGASTLGPRNEHVAWTSFGTDTRRWRDASLDVLAAVQYLRTSGATRVVVVGSSFGATASLLAATAQPPERAPIDALAMLSPGEAYRGVDARDAMETYLRSGRPLWALAGEGDGPSAAAVRALLPVALPHVTRRVIEGASEHGVALGNRGPDGWNDLDGWIRARFAPAQPPSAMAPDASNPLEFQGDS